MTTHRSDHDPLVMQEKRRAKRKRLAKWLETASLKHLTDDMVSHTPDFAMYVGRYETAPPNRYGWTQMDPNTVFAVEMSQRGSIISAVLIRGSVKNLARFTEFRELRARQRGWKRLECDNAYTVISVARPEVKGNTPDASALKHAFKLLKAGARNE